ncbi:MLO-like protein 3 [Rhodamnia argentea]|uniref:MLO-like protein n=1 Tax=Rhodamnia argentea TaxID=178133 RepID=A0A8B8Q5T8_9MYRT|nr:MLO-like protein 3 [Rhodamnia argentea]
MAGGGGATTGSSLLHTPTWALAVVCFFFISTSLILEHLIDLLTNWLKRHRKRALTDAVERLKSELMLLGFISLLLAVTQQSISNICISAELADTMLPCKKQSSTSAESMKFQVERFLGEMVLVAASTNSSTAASGATSRKLLWLPWRQLADEKNTTAVTATNSTAIDPCSSKGKVSLVTPEGIQQLQIFIFVLAVMQIVYSVITMALGRLKMRRWEAWERETQTTEYRVANDPNRFRFTRQTTFGRRHMTAGSNTSVNLWMKCFFRQFFRSVAKVDYLTLRHGFISAHLSARNNNFNFQKYIQRSLDEDFKVVVGISPVMWLVVVIFMLVDVHGWNVYLWVSYVPLLLVLMVGTKLEVIVARMALQMKNQNSVIIGAPLVRPNDDLFWFGHPGFVLTLLHYTLFVNAFELAFFIWVTVLFGVHSCYHEHTVIIVTRVFLAVTVQVLCCYITLPLYALVTQMGSRFKSKVLEEQMANVIKQWHAEVRERRNNSHKLGQSSFQSPRTSLSLELNPSRASPAANFDPMRSSFGAARRAPDLSAPSSSSHARGEITEEGFGEDDEARVEEGGSSSSRGKSRASMLYMPSFRR